MGTKGDTTRKRLIETARRLFRHHGYASTSIEDICRESGVKRGNLYFCFKNKQELALAALDDAAAQLITYFDILVADEAEPLNRIEAIIDGIVSFHADRHCKPGCFFGNFAQELGTENPTIAKGAALFFAAWRAQLAAHFEQARRQGLLREDADGESLSLLVISVIEGALLMCKASGDVDAFRKTAALLKKTLRLYRSDVSVP